MSHFADDTGRDVVRLSDVEIPASFYERITTGSQTLDILLGGEELPGIMPGTTWLVTGSPGSGKSTLLMQLLECVARNGQSCLYNSGEESVQRLAHRARRLGIDGGSFSVSTFPTMAQLEQFVREAAVQMAVVDSLQSLVDGQEESVHGLVKRFVRLAKETGCTFLLIGHVTKGGVFAGRNTIEHDVDAHMRISINKDTGNRVIEVVKNRVGPTMIPYEFTMTSSGIDLRRVEQPAAESEPERFLAEVKRLLQAGEKLSGYSHDEHEGLRALNRSGGFMRAMLSRAVHDLERQGFVVYRQMIDRREHVYIDVPPDVSHEET